MRAKCNPALEENFFNKLFSLLTSHRHTSNGRAALVFAQIAYAYSLAPASE